MYITLSLYHVISQFLLGLGRGFSQYKNLCFHSRKALTSQSLLSKADMRKSTSEPLKQKDWQRPHLMPATAPLKDLRSSPQPAAPGRSQHHQGHMQGPLSWNRCCSYKEGSSPTVQLHPESAQCLSQGRALEETGGEPSWL